MKLRDLNILGSNKDFEKEILIKVRSTGKLLKAKINIDNNKADVEILEKETGISPGQACVFYNQDMKGFKVLGGGWIDKTFNKLPIPIIFSSSCATYGNPLTNPIVEDTPQVPINPYGKSKLFIEEIIKDLGHSSNLKSVILRYFNAAGAMPNSSLGEMHSPETHLIPTVVYKNLLRKKIYIYGRNYKTKDGTCIRDYIHIKDICGAIEKSINFLLKNNNKFEIINIGSSSKNTTCLAEILLERSRPRANLAPRLRAIHPHR